MSSDLENNTPLPEPEALEVQDNFQSDPNLLKAYNICYILQQESQTNVRDTRYSRILGHLLLHAPNRSVREEVSKCISSCSDNETLLSLGEFFQTHVLVPCEYLELLSVWTHRQYFQSKNSGGVRLQLLNTRRGPRLR